MVRLQRRFVAPCRRRCHQSVSEYEYRICYGYDEKDGKLILEPDGKTLVDELVRLYIFSTVWSVLLEAKTGEHSARMTAMTAATDNTEQLLETLNLELNHARQSAITKEITEIVGGANALRDSKEGKRA